MTDATNERLFCPELPEEGAEEAVRLIECFKEKLKAAADEAISDLYCHILPTIESDAWTNMRNILLDRICDYSNSRTHSSVDYKRIREAIFHEFRDEIIADLNQDLLDEIASLKRRLDSGCGRYVE